MINMFPTMAKSAKPKRLLFHAVNRERSDFDHDNVTA